MRVFILPRRNDLFGSGLQLLDLAPNTSQRNSILDGVGQTGYLPRTLDVAGDALRPTVLEADGITYRSGTTNSLLAGGDIADDDTTGGGDDVQATTRTLFGLAAYIFDRVHAGGTAAADAPRMAPADCNTVATQIRAVVEAGTALTLAAINAILAGVAADTDLDGAAATSKSFGSVEDILRILSGEVYRVPRLTILALTAAAGSDFRSEAERQAFLDAQTLAQRNAQGTFQVSGGFLTSADAGFRAVRTYVQTGALNASLSNGQLSVLLGNMTILNTGNFAYTAADETANRPRARDAAGTALPATGVHPAVIVYDETGAVLS